MGARAAAAAVALCAALTACAGATPAHRISIASKDGAGVSVAPSDVGGSGGSAGAPAGGSQTAAARSAAVSTSSPKASAGAGAAPGPSAVGTPPGPSASGQASQAGVSPQGGVQGVVRAGPCINAEPTTPSPTCPGNPVAGTNVDFTPSSGGITQVTTTGPDGSYRIDLAPGGYTVKVEGRVFNVSNPAETRSVTVTAGTTTTLNLFVDTGIRGPAPATP